ncbi:uncharacterized protein [Notothenia coriiceps]|uniref:Uncharacterized protein n=1 Tax=Notothenia coriiceps TaxID=8208 RepID=A0A6I9N0L7_9TELE|nr:PREDICTED: uncharacterized protein LOC104946084 [Notothenia coriiceps]
MGPFKAACLRANIFSCRLIPNVLCFPALKRSFEVEETESSTNPSTLTRRNTNPLRSSASSTSSQRSYDQSFRSTEYSSPRSSPSETTNPRSPKTGMRRMELSGGRNPDTASSRRTEMSIEVSSKQIDNSPSAGIARFGLKRPEVSLSNRSTLLDSSSNSTSTNRRAEISMTRQHEPPAPPKRTDSQMSSTPISRIPEPPQRTVELQSPITSPVEAASRKPAMPIFRQSDGLVPSSAVENNNNNHPPPAPSAPLPSLAEPRVEKVERVERVERVQRVQSPVPEPPTARPTERLTPCCICAMLSSLSHTGPYVMVHGGDTKVLPPTQPNTGQRFEDIKTGRHGEGSREIHYTYHKQTGVDRGAALDKCGCVPNGYVFQPGQGLRMDELLREGRGKHSRGDEEEEEWEERDDRGNLWARGSEMKRRRRGNRGGRPEISVKKGEKQAAATRGLCSSDLQHLRQDVQV